MHTIEISNLPTFLSISSKHIKLCSYLCHFRFSERTNRIRERERERERKKLSNRRQKKVHIYSCKEKRVNEKKETKGMKKKIQSDLARVYDSFVLKIFCMLKRFHKHIYIEGDNNKFAINKGDNYARCVQTCVCVSLFAFFFCFMRLEIEASEFIFRKRTRLDSWGFV